MQYRLVTTQKGLVPIEKITKGTLVLCKGEWKEAPEPTVGKALKLTFDTLPTTIFEKRFATKRQEVSVNHKPLLNQLTDYKPELAFRGYTDENVNRDYKMVCFINRDNALQYWYPKLIRLCNTVITPTITETSVCFYSIRIPKFKELEGTELSERNLEYYLEGLLRKKFFYSDKSYKLTEKPSESDRLVLRLLNIDTIKVSGAIAVRNDVSFLKHIKDDFNKSKLTDNMIQVSLMKSIELPQYTSGYRIIKKEEVEDLILEGINPDINCINPVNDYLFDYNLNEIRASQRYDSKGRIVAHYNKNSIYEKLIRNS